MANLDLLPPVSTTSWQLPLQGLVLLDVQLRVPTTIKVLQSPLLPTPVQSQLNVPLLAPWPPDTSASATVSFGLGTNLKPCLSLNTPSFEFNALHRLG